METLDQYNQIHNNIKPQNYLIKFLSGENELLCMKIVLTDFEWTGYDSEGGTPIFASPECFEIKTNASDIFSLGRVFLFVMLPNEAFLKCLFVPITSAAEKFYLANTILNQNNLFGLISTMIRAKKSERIGLSQVRIIFNDLMRNSKMTLNSLAKTEIERIVNQNLSPKIMDYIQNLDSIS